MDIDNDTVSSWFVLNSGFKVYGRCPACHSPRLAYYKERQNGLMGISPKSKGITPICLDCGRSLPTKALQTQKSLERKTKKSVGYSRED